MRFSFGICEVNFETTRLMCFLWENPKVRQWHSKILVRVWGLRFRLWDLKTEAQLEVPDIRSTQRKA